MSHPHSDAHLPRQKNLKQAFSGVTGGYLQKHSLAFVCVCVLSDRRRLWSVHRHSGTGCRVSGEWQTDRLTASEVVSGGFLLRRCRWVNYQGLWCALGCARDLYKDRDFFFFKSGWGWVFLFFFVGDIMRDSLAVYLFSDHYSSKPLIPHDSDGQGWDNSIPASPIDFITAHTVPTPSSDHHLISLFFPFTARKIPRRWTRSIFSTVYRVGAVVSYVIFSRL